MPTGTKAGGKKTREKLAPKQKRCFGCKQVKHKFKDFKPRWGRCSKHKEQGKPFQEKCKGCQEARGSNIRQPRCLECDAQRTKKEKVAPVAATVGKKKGKKAAATATPVEVPAPAAQQGQQAPAAPAPTVVETPAPVAVQQPPAPAPVPQPEGASATLAVVAGLLDEPAVQGAPGSEVPAQHPFDLGVLANNASTPLLTTAESKVPEVTKLPPVTPAGAGPSGNPSGGTEPATRFRGPPAQGPRLAVRGKKGCAQKRHYPQANLTEIKRMLAALTTREARVASAEQKLADTNRRLRLVIAELRNTELPADEILKDARYMSSKRKRDHAMARVQNAREWRDFTGKRVRLYLDHALTTTPFVSRRCRACDNGVISDQFGATIVCPACKGTKTVRINNPNPFAKAAVPILKHISRVLEEAELCFKIRARTEDSEAAFAKLLAENQGLVKKFGNPAQTALEGDDAEQGAIMGLFDGAKRFDPTRATNFFCPRCEHERKIDDSDYETVDEVERLKTHQKCPKCGLEKMMLGTSTATYRTYAWNWTKRNSRARKDTEKRPGLVHASLDDPGLGGKSVEDGGIQDQVTMIGGRASIAGDQNLGESEVCLGVEALDLRDQIDSLEDPQHRQVLECILASMQPGEIASKLGITTRQVAKIKDAAFVHMRRKLASYLEV